MTNIQPYRFEIGPYRMTVVSFGTFKLDGGAMFGVVPKPLWNKLIPADEQNRIPLGLNVMLIEFDDQKILIDTGIGSKLPEKSQGFYDMHGSYDPADWLGELETDVDEITQVWLTHLHFDHVGGATTRLADGRMVPTYPNARFFAHIGEWDRALAPNPRSKPSYIAENLYPLKESGRLVLFDDPVFSPIPDFTMRLTGGHTLYHQAIYLDRPEGGFMYWGDLIPSRHHVKINYVMGYDEYPLASMTAKQQLLAETTQKGWLHIFEHDPEHPVCRIEPTSEKDTYAITPLNQADLDAWKANRSQSDDVDWDALLEDEYEEELL
jgi:glyoxylase-like metal-dependent hydrolase (beta-lactamase superfamily II)